MAPANGRVKTLAPAALRYEFRALAKSLFHKTGLCPFTTKTRRLRNFWANPPNQAVGVSLSIIKKPQHHGQYIGSFGRSAIAAPKLSHLQNIARNLPRDGGSGAMGGSQPEVTPCGLAPCVPCPRDGARMGRTELKWIRVIFMRRGKWKMEGMEGAGEASPKGALTVNLISRGAGGQGSVGFLVGAPQL